MNPASATTERIAELVRRCQGLSHQELRDYNEENTKKDFILPLFEALGWNVSDQAEVSAEHPAGRGRVDYTFKRLSSKVPSVSKDGWLSQNPRAI